MEEESGVEWVRETCLGSRENRELSCVVNNTLNPFRF